MNQQYQPNLEKLKTIAESKVILALARARESGGKIIELEEPVRREFISELSRLMGMCEMAEVYAREGNVDGTVSVLVEAMKCKDVIYSSLIQSRIPSEHGQSGRGYVMIGGKGVFEALEELRGDIRQNLTQQVYKDAETKCMEILGVK